MVVLWVVEVGITVAVAGASDAADTVAVICAPVVFALPVDAAWEPEDIADVVATAVVDEFACVIVDESAAADMDDLDAVTDEVEAYTCCMQHIKNNANFRRWGKVICKRESKEYYN